MTSQLTPAEIAMFRAICRPAIIILVMLRINRPTGARELADILAIDEHTVSKYLRTLSRLNLIARTERYNGYILLRGGQLILGEAALEKTLPSATTSTTTIIETGEPAEEEVFIKERPNAKNLQSQKQAANLTPILKALQEAGIGEPKRSRLANLPHITPEYVNGWKTILQLDKAERYSTGLLIHVLECADPLPELNAYGHRKKCSCPACQRRKYALCRYCHQYPCECDEEE